VPGEVRACGGCDARQKPRRPHLAFKLHLWVGFLRKRGVIVFEKSESRIRFQCSPTNPLGIHLAEFADELAGMGWDLETLGDDDLGLLEMVYGPESQIENASQIRTNRLEFSLN